MLACSAKAGAVSYSVGNIGLGGLQGGGLGLDGGLRGGLGGELGGLRGISIGHAITAPIATHHEPVVDYYVRNPSTSSRHHYFCSLIPDTTKIRF